MVMLDYFENLEQGLELIIAIGSLMGMLGLILGFMLLLFPVTTKSNRPITIGIIAASAILVAICGLSTGIHYFRIH
ncbi:MAG: hypothetical protein ACFFAO_01535 [Candidatus Hermodarchaeota archaeon]